MCMHAFGVLEAHFTGGKASEPDFPNHVWCAFSFLSFATYISV
jgi:hypothetical protein